MAEVSGWQQVVTSRGATRLGYDREKPGERKGVGQELVIEAIPPFLFFSRDSTRAGLSRSTAAPIRCRQLSAPNGSEPKPGSEVTKMASRIDTDKSNTPVSTPLNPR